MKPFISSLLVLAVISFANCLPAQDTSSLSDFEIELQALEATTPTAATNAPELGTFYSAQNPDSAPLPANINNSPVWSLGDGFYVLDDTNVNYASLAQAHSVSRASGLHAMDEMDEDDFAPALTIDSNSLYLQITNLSAGQVYLNLMNSTDYVYEIYSKTDLSATNWEIAAELFPAATGTNCLPFVLSPATAPSSLFIWARDWTGITSGGNTTPEWWFYKYFGTVDLADTNMDSFNEQTLLADYLAGRDPNVIEFDFDFPLTPLSNNPVSTSIEVLAGNPAYMAVLVNDTNQADAVWQPYTSNLVVNLNSGNGAYTVWVGLRGLAEDGTQTWQSNRVSLFFVPPTLTITNPVASTVSVPFIQLQGLANESLSSLTYDVSNAAGIFTNQTGYYQPAFYDTNLLIFTTNSFQCYDLALTNGLNTITLHATDLNGNTVTTNVSYTLDYSIDHVAPVLSILWPTNGTAIAGSNFTLQAQMDDDTATVTATVNSNIVAGLVERDGTVWINNLPLDNGTNTVTITATDAAGNISTTNFNVIQSPVSLTIDPISSDQLNQSSVSVTGMIDNSNDTITVNGQGAYFTDCVGDWEADNVPVNPTGTASLDVEVSDSDNNPIASQAVNQPQPALVAAVSYQSSEHIIDIINVEYIPGVDVDNSADYWLINQGGQWSNWSWGESLDGYWDDGPVSASNGGEIATISTWENASLDGSFYPYQNLQESVQTKVAILPGGAAPVGTTASYLVLTKALASGGQPLAPEWLQIKNQPLINTGITNDDGSVWGAMLVSGPAGAQVDVTPSLIPSVTLATNDYTFQMQVLKTKEDWQADVRTEINQDSGYTAVISQYLAANGFSFQNRTDIKAVYAFYQKVYLEQPTEYYWCGLAKLAGAPVYAALSDAQHAAPLLYNFQDTLVGMNIAILNDLAWQFEAYRKGGLQALEVIYAVDTIHTNLDLAAITAWRNIDQGIQQNNQALILEGNESLLQREQQQVLAFGYSQLNSMDAGLIANYMSILAQCPIWDPSTSEPYAGRGFYAIVPGGNLTTYNDRWTWITYPTGGIWDTWVNLLLTDKTSQVSLDLRTRANTYATLPLY